MTNFWLLKSEPDVFGICDLKAKPNMIESWDGVRNYQARNFMKEMKKGDLAFFYHSNANPSGLAGIVEIAKEAYPDHTAFDEQSKYFDPKGSPDNPRWFMVDVKFQEKFSKVVPLSILKSIDELKDLTLVQKGSRLSVMPISKFHWEFLLNFSHKYQLKN